MDQEKYKAKNGYNPLDDLHKKLKAQYDKDEELDPNREMPKNTLKKENKKMKNKLQELINQLVREELSLMEKKKKKEEEPMDLNLDIDTPAGDEELNLDTAPADDTLDMNMGTDTGNLDMGGSGDGKEIGDHLQAALEAAKRMPDSETKSKLIRQIGNTALFFLKTQIPTGDQA